MQPTYILIFPSIFGTNISSIKIQMPRISGCEWILMFERDQATSSSSEVTVTPFLDNSEQMLYTDRQIVF